MDYGDRTNPVRTVSQGSNKKPRQTLPLVISVLELAISLSPQDVDSHSLAHGWRRRQNASQADDEERAGFWYGRSVSPLFA